MSAGDADEIARLDAALQEWRQGDATLEGGLFFVHLADKRLPLTALARNSLEDAGEENVFDVLSSVRGLVVVTQSCDIVKPCAKAEYVEVSPLVHIGSDDEFYQIQKGRRSLYAYLPGLADRKLVVDLERTMTVEKAVVAKWTRFPGCATDEERVAFAEALARKRRRFAFPDGFNSGLAKFRGRLKDKEGKDSPEGRLISALDEIRAQARPNWGASDVMVFFWFLLNPDQNIDFDESRKTIESWMKLMALSAPFAVASPSFALVEQGDMTVRDYLTSHHLDYDELSL